MTSASKGNDFRYAFLKETTQTQVQQWVFKLSRRMQHYSLWKYSYSFRFQIFLFEICFIINLGNEVMMTELNPSYMTVSFKFKILVSRCVTRLRVQNICLRHYLYFVLTIQKALYNAVEFLSYCRPFRRDLKFCIKIHIIHDDKLRKC